MKAIDHLMSESARDLNTARDDGSMQSVSTYVPAPGSVRSSVFSLTAGQNEVFVENFRSVHCARFVRPDSEVVCIQISVRENVQSCEISPRRLGVVPEIAGNRVNFVLPRGQRHLLVQINDLEHLVILADPLEVSGPKPSDSNVVNVMDFDVDNTGNTVETAKIQQAIDHVLASKGKDTLYFPNGCYRTGTLRFGGRMKVYLEEGALIKGSLEYDDYPVFSGFENSSHAQSVRKLLLIHDADGFELSGRGVIDGEGAALVDKYQKYFSKLIDLVEAVNCRNLVIRDVMLTNSSHWACLLCSTENALIDNVKILNGPHHLEMDSFDVSDSRNILYQNCFAYSHDDCWAIMTLNRYQRLGREETRNIRVEGGTGWTLCHGARIGWNSNEMIDDVVFEDVDFIHSAMRHVVVHRLKDEKRWGTITFKNCRFEMGERSDLFLYCEAQNHGANESVDGDRLRFIDCSIDAPAKGRSLVWGSDKYGVKEVAFQNVRIGDKVVKSTSDLADFGLDFVNVEKVTIVS